MDSISIQIMINLMSDTRIYSNSTEQIKLSSCSEPLVVVHKVVSILKVTLFKRNSIVANIKYFMTENNLDRMSSCRLKS